MGRKNVRAQKARLHPRKQARVDRTGFLKAAPTLPNIETIAVPLGRCGGRRGKLKFRTRGDAIKALTRARQDRSMKGSKYAEERVYFCESICRNWHLTHLSQEAYDAIKGRGAP